MKKKSLISIHLLLQYIKYPFFLFYIIIRILLSLIIQLHVLLLQLHQKDIHIHINNIHLIYLINNQFLHHRNLILHQPHLYHNNHIHLYHLFFLIHRFHMFLCQKPYQPNQPSVLQSPIYNDLSQPQYHTYDNLPSKRFCTESVYSYYTLSYLV